MLKFAKKERKEREALQANKGLKEPEVKEEQDVKEEKEIKDEKEVKEEGETPEVKGDEEVKADAEDGAEAKDSDSSENYDDTANPENSDDSKNTKSSKNSESSENSDDFDNSENPEDSDDSESVENPDEVVSDGERRNYSEVEEAYCLGAGIDTATLSEAKALLYEVADAVRSGRFVPELLRKAICLLNYDRDVEKARREGIEEGRLEKLKEALDAKTSAAKEADAIPHLGGSKSLGNAAQSDSIFNLARDAK